VNSTATSKNSVSLFFFFESQQIKITVQAQESTKITSPATAPKFVEQLIKKKEECIICFTLEKELFLSRKLVTGRQHGMEELTYQSLL
jgi:hypothetical protein